MQSKLFFTNKGQFFSYTIVAKSHISYSDMFLIVLSILSFAQ